MRIVLAVLALVACGLSPAGAQSPAPSGSAIAGRDKVDTMFRDRRASADWFAKELLARMSLADIDAAIARISSQLGPYTGVDGTNGDYTAHFDKGIDEVFVHLNTDDKIDYLVFRSPLPAGP
jgi:hypothetical protein